jgi:uncharacterized paraquat-inducible protein A
VPFDFTCEHCGWEGADPTLDAHSNAWCPRCGKPAEFTEIVKLRKKRP